jgi:hypothetical protein
MLSSLWAWGSYRCVAWRPKTDIRATGRTTGGRKVVRKYFDSLRNVAGSSVARGKPRPTSESKGACEAVCGEFIQRLRVNPRANAAVSYFVGL